MRDGAAGAVAPCDPKTDSHPMTTTLLWSTGDQLQRKKHLHFFFGSITSQDEGRKKERNKLREGGRKEGGKEGINPSICSPSLLYRSDMLPLFQSLLLIPLDLINVLPKCSKHHSSWRGQQWEGEEGCDTPKLTDTVITCRRENLWCCRGFVNAQFKGIDWGFVIQSFITISWVLLIEEHFLVEKPSETNNFTIYFL